MANSMLGGTVPAPMQDDFFDRIPTKGHAHGDAFHQWIDASPQGITNPAGIGRGVMIDWKNLQRDTKGGGD